MNNSCEICNGKELLSLDESYQGTDIVACRNCGLVWNRNMNEEPEQEKFYREENRVDGPVRRGYLISMLGRAACAFEFLGASIKAGMRHLDVGCAEGTLLALTRAHGLEVVGLELDQNFSRFARDVRGLEVLPVTLDSAPLGPASFDVISFVHVVEHLVHPTEVLAEAHKLLRDDGLLYIEVPNLHTPLPGLRHFFRPKHNYYFTANTLRALLSKAGFEPLRVGYSGRDSSVQVLAKKGAVGTEAANALRWRDDAKKIKAKVARERGRHHLLLRLLFTRALRQRQVKHSAMQRYGNLLPEIAETK